MTSDELKALAWDIYSGTGPDETVECVVERIAEALERVQRETAREVYQNLVASMPVRNELIGQTWVEKKPTDTPNEPVSDEELNTEFDRWAKTAINQTIGGTRPMFKIGWRACEKKLRGE